MILKIDEKGCIFSAEVGLITVYNPYVEIEKESTEVNIETNDYYHIFDFYYKNTLLKIDNKDDFYKDYKKEKVNVLEKEIVNTLNAMVLNAIPVGETLTPENVPSLLDIINQATSKESGTQTNPIIIIDNDIAHNGYLYTYGKYYKWNNVLYQCKRTGESDGGTIKLFYTPDKMIGHYFVTV